MLKKKQQDRKLLSSIPIMKISVLGGINTGKTSLCTQYVNNFFSYNSRKSFEIKFWLNQKI